MASFTEKAIMETFLELLEKKPIEKITVREIVDNCGINRNTFYYHYDGIPALMEAVLRDNLEQMQLETADYESWEEQFLEVAKASIDNKKSIYHIFNSVSREVFERYLGAISERIMKRFVRKLAEGRRVSDQDLELIIVCCKSALMGVVLEWLTGGMKYDYETAIRRLGVILNGSIETMLDRAEQEPK